MSSFPGTDRALRETAQTCGLSRHLTAAVGGPDDPAVDFLLDYIRHQSPQWLILGGWSPLYERFITALPGLRLAVYWTSSPGQVEIGGEAETLARLLQDVRIDARLFVSKSLRDGLAGAWPGLYHLPNTFAEPELRPRTSAEPPSLSLFCSPFEYRRKNVLNVLLALASIGLPFRLHVNGLGAHPFYRELLTRRAIPYVDHGWMSGDAYRTVLAGIDLGLQPSFSESFGYVVAEHLLQGIPVVTSAMVPIMDELSPRVRRHLVVDRADTAAALGEAVTALLADPARRRRLGQQARQELLASNRRQVEVARQTLEHLLTR